MPAPVLQFKRGNASFDGSVPALRPGEPAISLNNYDFFVGIDTTVAGNKFFGSHRYWGREDGTNSLQLKLVDRDGLNSINLRSPNVLSGVTTYVLPETPVDGALLRTNNTGELSWTTNIPVISGIVSFSDTTDNTLGDPTTGAVRIAGGLGVAKNVTVGAGLSVGGQSYFIGTVTFYGGTINIGDSNTDNINIGGEFVSSLNPNNDNSYDIGIGTQRWKDAYFAGIGSFASGVYANSISLGTTAANKITTTTGNLVLDSSDGIIDSQKTLEITGDLNVSGVSTIATIQIGVSGYNVIDTLTGNLSIDSDGGLTKIDDNLIVVGFTSITGSVSLASTSTDNIDVYGTARFYEPISGSISTATRASLIDNSQASPSVYYPGLFASSISGLANQLYVDPGISLDTSLNKLILTGDLEVNGGDFISTSTTFNALTSNVTNLNLATSATDIVIANTTGITTISNDLVVGGDLQLNGNDIKASDGTTNITLQSGDVTIFAGDIRVSGNDIQASDGNPNITLTSNTLTSFVGDIRVNGGDIQASDGNVNISMSSNNLTEFAGDIRVGGNDIQASDGQVNIVMTSNTLTEVKGNLQISGNKILSGIGATVLTLNTSDAIFENNLTVNGSLFVNGSTTQVNVGSLSVEDRTIELGKVDGSDPTSATTWDLGILFNYYTDSAKKSSVIWEHSVQRFQFGSETQDTGGTDNDSPQVVVSTFAPIEISGLWVNDCSGQSQVISCTSGVRNLENITIDAGTF